MSVPYSSLSVEVAAEDSGAVEAQLLGAGALGLEVRDERTAPMPNTAQPGPGRALVIAFFAEPCAASAAGDLVRGRCPDATLTLEEVPAQDWSRQWRALVRSVRAGRLWVGPPWEAPPRDAVPIVIEPKMAFGTGDHPTTALCLAAVDAFLGEHPGASVLDVGCGTGVLAVAAKKLGASRVVATDNDPIAVGIARETASANGVLGLSIGGGSLESIEGSFDLVVANILANTLIELAPALVEKTSVRLSLAGVLDFQADAVEAVFRAAGMTPSGRVAQGEWVRLDFGRPNG